MSVTQVMEQYQAILEEEVREIAWETGAVRREGKLDAATLAQIIIFGFWQDPEIRLSGLAQIGGRREVYVTGSAISQRFTPECAMLFLKVLQRIAEVDLESDKVDIPLLKQFSEVIVEDSTSVTLPRELAEVWLGCGGGEGASEAGVKAFVQWDVLKGKLLGPRLSDARMNDHKTPFEREELPEGSWYLADLGFFAIERFFEIAKGKAGKRYFVSRLQTKTNIYNRRGYRIDLAGILPKLVGQVRDVGVVLGQKKRLPVRLLLVKVPEDVAKERQDRIRRTAQKNGNGPSEELLE
jgi:hypothetical protein